MTLLAIASLSLVGAGIAQDPTLYPVSLGDPVLQAEETYLSETAQAFAASTDTGTLRCLDLSEPAAGHSRICLTSGEWQVVFDQLVERASEDRSYALFLTDLEFQRTGQSLDVADFVPPPSQQSGGATTPRQ